MSAEETELTFIRCPSCRSLVPAVATRCRMCGHQFEKKSIAAEEETVEEISKKENMDSSATRPRVRQRTMSSDSKQVSEIKEQLKVSLDQDVSSPKTAEVLESDFENDDVAEDFEEESVFAVQKNTTETEKSYSFDKPSSGSFSFEQKSALNKEKEEKIEKSFTETKKSELSLEDVNTAEVFSPKAAKIEESILSPKGTKMEESILSSKATKMEESILSSKATKMEEGILSPKAAKMEENVLSSKAAKIEVQTDKVNMETKTETQFGEATTTTNGKKALAENTFSKEVVVENDGKLFGWLIAFGNDSRGSASEVRAGKFFIGRQKLRSADMLVPDSSVSTPHCMVTASSEAGLLVQDLLSEKGTFYKKAGSQSYVQVSHLVELGHGDWLKFGDYEVMVCLVPYEKNKKK